jgi:hypothetical protein
MLAVISVFDEADPDAGFDPGREPWQLEHILSMLP